MRKFISLVLAIVLLALLQTRSAGAKTDLPTGGNKKPPNPVSLRWLGVGG